MVVLVPEDDGSCLEDAFVAWEDGAGFASAPYDSDGVPRVASISATRTLRFRLPDDIPAGPFLVCEVRDSSCGRVTVQSGEG